MADTPRGYPVPASTDVVSLDAVQDLADAIDTDVTAVVTSAGSALASHEADTTSVHGIANTALLVATSDTGTVATAMIADDAVTTAKIAAGAVATADLADSAVTSAKIADGTIVNTDVNAAAAIAPTKVAGTAVTQADTGTVTNTMLAGSIAPAKVTGTAVVTGDSRLSDARTPTAHAASHGTGQSDAITIAPAQVTGTAVVNTLVDAKGDLVAASAADTPARLAVGVAGTNPILTPDTSAASGLAWKSHADADVAQASTVGNLLTSNQASGTDTLGTTEGFRGAGGSPTLASSTSQALTGSSSLKVTTTLTTATNIVSNPVNDSSTWQAATPGETLTAFASLYSSDTANWRIALYFYDSAGAFISATFSDFVAAATSWKQLTVTAVAPATAARVFSLIGRDTGASGADTYFDNLSLHRGAGGLWVMPGVPIPNLGIRANPADSTQVQIWNPGNSTWITV